MKNEREGNNSICLYPFRKLESYSTFHWTLQGDFPSVLFHVSVLFVVDLVTLLIFAPLRPSRVVGVRLCCFRSVLKLSLFHPGTNCLFLLDCLLVNKRCGTSYQGSNRSQGTKRKSRERGYGKIMRGTNASS